MSKKGDHINRVKSLSDLAVRLDYSLTSINNWKKIEGAPGKENGFYSVTKWRRFIKKKGLGIPLKQKAGSSGSSPRDEVAQTQAELLKLKLKKEQERTFDRDEVSADWKGKITEALSLLESKFVIELPSEQEGLDALEISEMNEKALDEVREALSKC